MHCPCGAVPYPSRLPAARSARRPSGRPPALSPAVPAPVPGRRGRQTHRSAGRSTPASAPADPGRSCAPIPGLAPQSSARQRESGGLACDLALQIQRGCRRNRYRYDTAVHYLSTHKMNKLILPRPTAMANNVCFGIFTIHKHLNCSADIGAVTLKRQPIEQRQRLLQPTAFHVLGELIRHLLGLGVGSRRILKDEGAVETDLLHQVESCLKISFSLARKSDNDIRRDGNV